VAIKLNINSPRPLLTNQLVSMGLSFAGKYKVQWSKEFKGQWDIKDYDSKKVVLTLQAWKVQELLKNKILIADELFLKRDA
jgi:hypothetical protein